jgi:sugar phosphate isomerase/epimerase
MFPTHSRRDFLRDSTLAGAAAGLAVSLPRGLFAQDPQATTQPTGQPVAPPAADGPLFKLCLGEYSLHVMIQNQRELDNRDFAPFAKNTLGFDAVDYWSRPFNSNHTNAQYLAEMKKKADDAGVKGVLILVDDPPDMGQVNEPQRLAAIDGHKPWVEAAKTLGCDGIRVNARSQGMVPPEEMQKHTADGLRRLSEFAAPLGIDIVVENHGGLSSNGAWLAAVLKEVNLPNCGSLPDFNNWTIGPGQQYDRYQGVLELMPSAKVVCAKGLVFDDQGNERNIDFRRMFKIVVDAGFRGYVELEYEGTGLSEVDGVRALKTLVERVRDELAAAEPAAPPAEPAAPAAEPAPAAD